jgi:hypothetical protein
MKFKRLLENNDNLHQMPWEHLHAITHNHLLSHGFEEQQDHIPNGHHWARSSEYRMAGGEYARSAAEDNSMITTLRDHGWHHFNGRKIGDDDIDIDAGQYMFDLKHPSGASLRLAYDENRPGGPGSYIPGVVRINWHAVMKRPR